MRILSGNINLEVKDLGSKTHTPLIMISGFGSQLIDWPKDLIEKLDQTMPDRMLDPIPVDNDEERPFFERVKDIFG